MGSDTTLDGAPCAEGDGALCLPASGDAIGPMRAVWQLVECVAPSELTVLVRGETGTGKELVARAIHQRSDRRAGPFKAINCAAIPATLIEATLFGHERGAFTGALSSTRGVFEQADGGTVFLDEVGELSLQGQSALLRVLETRQVLRVGGEREVPVDVRVVAASHRSLDAMCDDGAFRADLLFRLDAVTIEVPPLRERGPEIVRLAGEFLREAAAENGREVTGLTAAAAGLLGTYPWPGNVRELKNAIQRAVVVSRGPLLDADDLPARVRGATSSAPPPDVTPRAPESFTPIPPPASTPFDLEDIEGLAYRDRVRAHTRAFEHAVILDALERTAGNQTRAAALLRLPLRTFVHKMRDLGIRRNFR